MADSAANPSTTTTDAGEVVRTFLAALDRLDLDTAMTLVTDDIVWENKSLPTVRGRAQFERAIGGMTRKLDGFEARVHHLAADDDIVLTERTDVMRKGDFEADFWVCGTFRVDDSRIVLWRDHFDFVDMTVGVVRGLVRLAMARRHA